jgi:outer membrane immunogenic protein
LDVGVGRRLLAWGVKKMKKVLLSCALLVLPCVGLAADVRPVPAPPPVYVPRVFDWTGLYIGGNIGYGSASVSTTATLLGVSATASETLTGVIGGVQLGGLMQWGFLVVGAEGDFQGSGQKKSTTIFGVTLTDSLSWFTTYRARFGIAIDRILLYGTAGGAYGEYERNATGLGIPVGTTTQRSGWTAGGGIEAAFANQFTARVEYLYIDTGDISSSLGLLTVRSRARDHIIRGALNFKILPWGF